MDWEQAVIHPLFSVLAHDSAPEQPPHSPFQTSHALPQKLAQPHMPKWTRRPRTPSTANSERSALGEQPTFISTCLSLCALFWYLGLFTSLCGWSRTILWALGLWVRFLRWVLAVFRIAVRFGAHRARCACGPVPAEAWGGD